MTAVAQRAEVTQTTSAVTGTTQLTQEDKKKHIIGMMMESGMFIPTIKNQLNDGPPRENPKLYAMVADHINDLGIPMHYRHFQKEEGKKVLIEVVGCYDRPKASRSVFLVLRDRSHIEITSSEICAAYRDHRTKALQKATANQQPS